MHTTSQEKGNNMKKTDLVTKAVELKSTLTVVELNALTVKEITAHIATLPAPEKEKENAPIADPKQIEIAQKASLVVTAGKNYRDVALELLVLVGYAIGNTVTVNTAALKVAKNEIDKAITIDLGPFIKGGATVEGKKVMDDKSRLYASIGRQLEMLTEEGRNVVKEPKKPALKGNKPADNKPAEPAKEKTPAELLEDLEAAEQAANLCNEVPEIVGMSWAEIVETFELEIFTAIHANKTLLASFQTFNA